MRPVGRIGDSRSCGATIIMSPNFSVFSNGRLVAVLGSLDSQGGIAQTTTFSLFAENLPVVLLGDINDVCRWVYPPHFCMPLVVGDDNVLGE